MENKYLLYNNKKMCNGCGLCALLCSQSAIKMIEDSEGFLYPEIDNEKCVNCKVCKETCSNFNKDNQYSSQAYMVINKLKHEKQESSSGGMFYIIAKYAISKKGIIFGVKYDEELNILHDWSDNLDGCKKFMGSKYARSDINDSYQKVKNFLEEGRFVLFTGTPCQINGLKMYLKKNYDNLVTCDIICHSNPSPKVFKKYVKNLELKSNCKVLNVHFRSKKNGWHNQTPVIEYEKGIFEEENSYFMAFASELIGRPSCHSCPFVSKNRQSDITIGDLWGASYIDKDIYDDDTGISFIIINSIKGKEIFNSNKSNMDYKQIDLNLAYKQNHYRNVPYHKNRKKFFKKVSNNQINENNIIDYLKRYTKMSIFKRAIRKIKRTIKR